MALADQTLRGWEAPTRCKCVIISTVTSSNSLRIPIHTQHRPELLLLLFSSAVSAFRAVFTPLNMFFLSLSLSCYLVTLQVLPPSLRPTLSPKSPGRCRWTRLPWVRCSVSLLPRANKCHPVHFRGIKREGGGANWYFLQVLFFCKLQEVK